MGTPRLLASSQRKRFVAAMARGQKAMVAIILTLAILSALLCLGVFLAVAKRVVVRPGIEPGSSGFQPDA